MAGPLGPVPSKGRIVGVRVRLGWRGQPVMQVQRQMVRVRFVAQGPDGLVTERCGTSTWHDAGKADAIELAQFLASAQVLS